jgi:hypothetical protein
MSQFVPPTCLLLGLAMLVAGFALLAVEPPPEPMELHQARVSGDDEYRDVLEGNVARQRLARKLLVGSLFGFSALMVVLAFLSMGPSCGPRGPRDPSTMPDFSSDEG